MPQKTTMQARVSLSAVNKCAFMMIDNNLLKPYGYDQVDQFDADEGNDHSPQAIDQQIAPQQRACTDGVIGDAAKRQRYQQGDDDGVEDHRRKNGALGTVQVHDIQCL